MNKKTFIIALITIIVWSSSFAGTRASLLGGIPSDHLALLRFLVASIVFAFYALSQRSRFKWPKKEDLLRIFILAFIGITLYYIAATYGQQTVTAGTTSMIVASAPIFAALIAVFVLKERMGLIRWIGLGIGFIGIFIITLGTTDANFKILRGIPLVLLATIATSIFFVLQKPLFKRYHPIHLTAYFTWAGTLPMLIFLPGLFESIQSATLEANVAAIYVGIFPSAICYAAWAIALSSGNTGTVMSMFYMEPLFAITIAWLWLGEIPSILSIIGGIVAISSVAIVNLNGEKRRESPDEKSQLTG
ncbi:DMT family transporter [Siminovitchia sediminis]|uniref:DMT family transporter n=1 Tax=Siminovitchia sediminis TaxID=1274353 RepID=A0ABW4KPR6_9BACI